MKATRRINGRGVLCSMVVAVVFGLAATGVHAAQAGSVLGIKGVVTASGADGTRELLKNDPVHEGETIETGDNSYVVIEFVDGAKATVRPNTALEIATYDNTEGAENALLNLVKGGLRAVTGGIAQRQPESYRVNTPVATLGVRGTEYYLRICEDDCAAEQALYVQNMYEQDNL